MASHARTESAARQPSRAALSQVGIMRLKASASTLAPATIPFWRDVRILRVLSQIFFVLALAVVAGFLYSNLQWALASRGMQLSFGFLSQTSGFRIAEGLTFEPTDPYWYAFVVGVVNTLKVISVGIVLATLLGLVAGVARLSSNWLIRSIASVYIEIFRNTPLLVQLFFWYLGVLRSLPQVSESVVMPGPIYLSNRGIALPWAYTTDGFSIWGYSMLAGLIIALAAYWLRRWQLRRAERPGFPLGWALLAFTGTVVSGYFLAPERPLRWEVPVLGRFNFEGGIQLSPEFAALLLGLVAYTGAFIAEIVRGAILSVQKGQKEAAKALGLTPLQVLRLVILPQALRVIIPPLISQYLNLAKNSSLAIAVGFPDLFSVAGTVLNQTGRAVEVILIVMASYLTMSLITSLLMNLYNRRIRFLER